MWPGNSVNPMASRFMAARAAAANVPPPGEQGSYTPAMFYADFPQFTKRIPPEEEGGEERVGGWVGVCVSRGGHQCPRAGVRGT